MSWRRCARRSPGSQADNARLLRLLELSPREARPPGPVQTGIFDAQPGPVHAGSPAAAKVAFYAALFGARRDVYALRWENARSGESGWMPAVQGGWRKGVPAAQREYLPLTAEVLTAHLSGELELGLYPLLDGDRLLAGSPPTSTDPPRCWTRWPTSRPPEPSARPPRWRCPAPGMGAHVWLFFTAPVPAATARQVGSGLLREAIAMRGRMDLASYDRLFPSQDVLAVGGLGNLIAAPLHGRARRARRHGLPRPRHAGAARGPVGLPVHLRPADARRRSPGSRLGSGRSDGRGRGRPAPAPPASTKIAVEPPAIGPGPLGAAITIHGADLPPPLLATLKHAASMPNPVFYERQRRRPPPGTPRAFSALRRDPRRRPRPPPRPAGPARHADRARPAAASSVTDHRDPGRPHDLRGSPQTSIPSSRPRTTPSPATTSESWSPRPAPARPSWPAR